MGTDTYELDPGIEIIQLYERERTETPNAFLLTLKEAKLLMRARRAETQALEKYSHFDEEQIKKPEIQAKIKEDILSAYHKKRISTANLLKACKKVQESRHWTFYLSEVIIGYGQQTHIYEYKSNIPGVGGKITPETFPNFYGKDHTVSEIAQILGIPDGTLYADDFELVSASHAYSVLAQTIQAPGDSKEQTFIAVKSSPIIDVFDYITRSSIRSAVHMEGFEDMYEITAKNGVKLTLKAEAYGVMPLASQNADKLLIQCNNKSILTGYKSDKVSISLSEFMNARKLKDRKEAAKKAREALNFIFAIALTAEEQYGGSFQKKRIVQSADYIQGKGQQESTLTIQYTSDYFNHLKRIPQQAQYPPEILAIPDNKKNSYIFAKEFCHSKRNNIGTGEENRLRVSTLLQYSTLPKYEDLPNKAQASQKIIGPFIDALDYLEEIGILSYEFKYSKTEKKGDELTEKDLQALFTDYALFSSLIVEVAWINEPDYSHLIERKRQQKAIAAAKETAPKKRGRPRKKPVK